MRSMPPKLESRSLVLVLRRVVFLALVACSAAFASMLMAEIMGANGLTVIGTAVLVLFIVSFTWLAISFWTAILGFLSCVLGRRQTVPQSAMRFRQRTAVVMPIYNEDPVRVAAGLEVALLELAKSGSGEYFDVFALSDTTEEAIAKDELAAIAALRAHYAHGPALYYRRRARNSGRKSGNIADFIRRWGGSYGYMLVLDADSIMSGQTIVHLVGLMERHADCGIIQTVPFPTNRDTLFSRVLQFASRLYGPVMAAGLAFWSSGDGNYYGHNAIIRISAFAQYCGLPVLPGREPLGGEILSHDFVEAALMRRAGYRVWILPELSGTYEELPANIIDYGKRDRRWSQGNLQHGRLLGLPGLKSVSRLHLFMGVTSYVMSPLWLLLLALSTADAMERALIGPVYWKPGFNLFPKWPISPDFQVHILLAITLGTLLLPKLLGLALVVFSRAKRRMFGGGRRILASVVLETVFSTLIAPIMMLFQTAFVVMTLAGRAVRWDSQPRGDRGVTWREAVERHASHMLLGLVWGGGVLWIVPKFAPWLLPVLTGLVLAVPVSVWSSRRTWGKAAKRIGLFLTPDETNPAPELREFRAALARGRPVFPRPIESPHLLVPPERGIEMPQLGWEIAK